MPSILICIVPDGFRDEEYSVPKDILIQNNITVVTTSTVPGKLTGKLGKVTATVDVLLADTQAKDYAGILIVGGQKTFWHNPKIISLIQEMHAAKKVIAAICISGAIPAQSGIMQGKHGTVFATEESLAELKKHGVIYQGNSLEIDDNIITANGPAAAADFAHAIVKLLKN